jgi:hypothetical protein
MNDSCGKTGRKEHKESQRKKLFASLRALCGRLSSFLGVVTRTEIVGSVNDKRDFKNLPFFENEEDGGEDEGESYKIIPFKALLEGENRKYAEDHERDHFLNHLQLSRRELIASDAVGRNLKAIFRQRDQPADQNDFPKDRTPMF